MIEPYRIKVVDAIPRVSPRSRRDELGRRGVEVIDPIGAHGVAIRPPDGIAHGAHALAARIYLEGGVRAGVFGGQVRFAVPRRVLTRDHLAYVAEIVGRAVGRPPVILECVHAPEEFLPFFDRFHRAPETGR